MTVSTYSSLPGAWPGTLRESDREPHPRVLRALHRREHVRAFTSEHGEVVVVLGQGLAGRCEVAVEVEPSARGSVARRALLDARRIAGPSGVLFAQAAPATAASVRSLLAAGFRPIGAEVLFFA